MRAVVFDYFGTLTPAIGKSEIAADMERIALSLGADGPLFSEAMSASWPERATGALGDARSTMVAVARNAGASPDAGQVEQALTIRMASFVKWAALRSDAAPTLEAIHDRGMLTAVVTDCPPEMGEVWNELEIAALVDVAVKSSELGTRKPDPEMFLSAARGLGVDPEECWYVGDGGGDELRGSAAVGMRPIWLDDADPSDRYVHGFAEGSDSIPRVRRLAELLDLIGRA